MLFDITPSLNSKLAVFPGDTPFMLRHHMRISEGAHLELSSFQCSSHIGAHADAPNHYTAHGESIEQRRLSLYLGKAQILRIATVPLIEVGHLIHRPLLASRILFATGSFDPQKWTDDFTALSPSTIDYLAQKGVQLIGIDTPSIDPALSKSLDAHHMVARHDMAILEGLELKHVPEGVYRLIALPLKIEGGEASPVRAILTDLNDDLQS